MAVIALPVDRVGDCRAIGIDLLITTTVRAPTRWGRGPWHPTSRDSQPPFVMLGVLSCLFSFLSFQSSLFTPFDSRAHLLALSKTMRTLWLSVNAPLSWLSVEIQLPTPPNQTDGQQLRCPYDSARPGRPPPFSLIATVMTTLSLCLNRQALPACRPFISDPFVSTLVSTWHTLWSCHDALPLVVYQPYRLRVP